MKVSRIQEAENHERILDVATRLFRERGIDGIGVADLMKAAGLTGALIVSRAVDDPDLSNEILSAVATTMHHNEVERSQSKTSTAGRSRTPVSKVLKGRSAKHSSRSRKS